MIHTIGLLLPLVLEYAMSLYDSYSKAYMLLPLGDFMGLWGF